MEIDTLKTAQRFSLKTKYNMKVISVLQPWATLIVIGAKKIETRSWNTQYRGPRSGYQNDIACKEPFYAILAQHGFIGGRSAHKCGFPLGMIIGRTELVATTSSEYLKDRRDSPILLNLPNIKLTAREEAFGDYSDNRYGWLLNNAIKFAEGMPAKGQLGIWNYNATQRGGDCQSAIF